MGEVPPNPHLFLNDETKEPLTFYLDPTLNFTLRHSITTHGGIIKPNYTRGLIHLIHGAPTTKSRYSYNHNIYSYLFVEDSIRMGKLEDLEKYNVAQYDPRTKKQGRQGFTIQEEMDMVSYVRENRGNPYARSYWERAAVILNTGHSALAYHDRYRRHTSKKTFPSPSTLLKKQLPPPKHFAASSPESTATNKHLPREASPDGNQRFNELVEEVKREHMEEGRFKREQEEDPLFSPAKWVKVEPDLDFHEPPHTALLQAKDIIITASRQGRTVHARTSQVLSQQRILQLFQQLQETCSELSGEPLTHREVLKTLLRLKGDLKAVKQFYSVVL